MHPIILKLGPINVYSYGLMVALGFSVATFLIYRRAPKFGLSRDAVLDLLILMLVTGLAGARILYVALNPAYYIANPLEILNLSKGGLVWYGAFFAAAIAAFFYVKRKALDFWNTADAGAPYFALAQALGRLGCFFNGCCFGVAAPAGFPFAVVFPESTVSRHPAQLYSSAALILIFIILRIWQDRRHFTGEIFLGYCLLYSLKRFALEFLRADNPKIFAGLTLSQCISVAIFLGAAVIFANRASKWRERTSSS